ncbi:putative aliphatic sulfonates transport permease protein SsuC [Halomonadaceae bacterium LMG 33818]|uniref:aliphatic sulfonate ABC transporter permease SsuC n=1 Tax=Cernens ardua TaxID=3402176 RepID=UPI003EDB7A02
MANIAVPSFTRRLFNITAPWLIPVLLIVIWEIACDKGWLSSRILPAPSAIVLAGWHLAQDGTLFSNLWASTQRALIGLVIGGGIGLVLGFLTGLSDIAAKLLDSSLQMIRNIPHLALIPLVILWFGIGETAKDFLVALGTVFPIYLNTYHGIRNVDPQLVEMAKSYGLRGMRLFWHVIFPGALPSILVGLRFALGIMWLTLIVAETISSTNGLGYLAMNAREFLQTDIVLLTIVLYALLGKIADLFAKGLEFWLLRWHPAFQRHPR